MISDILAKCTGFERDKYNSEKIEARHDVTPVECEQVFLNLPVIAGSDEKHSGTENRFYVLGQNKLRQANLFGLHASQRQAEGNISERHE
jgi:hypothetical protein